MNIKDAIQLIIDTTREHGLFTSSDTNETVAKRFEVGDSDNVQVILTNGKPSGTLQCSKCKEILKAEDFSYYQTRVDRSGYLMRSNAQCSVCRKKTNRKTRKVFESAGESIPDKPQAGDRCPHCERAWSGNWHRHHDPITEKFVAWWCSNCNMAQQDHRNPTVYGGTDGNK